MIGNWNLSVIDRIKSALALLEERYEGLMFLFWELNWSWLELSPEENGYEAVSGSTLTKIIKGAELRIWVWLGLL